MSAVVDHRLLGLDTTCTTREFPTKHPLFDFGDSRFSVIRVFLFFSIAEFRETPEIPCESKPKWHTSTKNIPHEWWTLVPSHSPYLFALTPCSFMLRNHHVGCFLRIAFSVVVVDARGRKCYGCLLYTSDAADE